MDFGKKSFLGIGFGHGGVPIDVVPLHLLGRLLPNYTLLVVDEFASFNGQDGTGHVLALERALDRLDKVYGRTRRLSCSNFMNSDGYTELLNSLKSTIERNDELRNLARKTVPEKYRNDANSLDYPINKVACVAHLFLDGFGLKIGPERERVYDKVLSVLNQNGRYGFKGFVKGLEFGYTLPAFSLSGKSVVPYIPNRKADRILLGDDESQVSIKLGRASEKSLKYLATLGYVADYVLRGNCMGDFRNCSGNQLRSKVERSLMDGIIRPYNGGG
ncbi:hypothetical protein A3K63_01675 [Candidatus Micrarchaeota archaeon RBG_16_49_10]|nr:MAG: hypothetical protein A3K63_01675 [Candidatus Micrarchaeota archaeon RBG_16_49_10]